MGYWLLPMIVLAYPLDMLLSHNLKKSNHFATGELSVWNDIFSGNVNSDIIICGSSRAWKHINSTRLGDGFNTTAYNLGLDGHDFELQNLRYNFFSNYNRKPKLIIYSLDIITLMKKDKDLYNADQFLPYLLWNDEFDKVLKAYKGYNSYDSKIPLLRYFGKYKAIKESVRMLAKRENTVTRVRGYNGQDLVWNPAIHKTKKIREITFDTALVGSFEKFVEKCRADDIDIVFVYTPDYVEWQKSFKNRDAIFELYYSLSKKHSIPFYDFSNDSMCLDKRYFFDPSHLNKAGAEIFTGKLIDSLKVRK